MNKGNGHTVCGIVSRKIGIKLLDRRQICSCLPNFNMLLQSIELQRNRSITALSQKQKTYTTQFHLMHDNIFGIFGGRGSGKTSILFSLHEILLERSRKNKSNIHTDIVLPIISPELISENCSLLAWVLAMFEDTINDMDQQLQRQPDLLRELNQQYRSKPECNSHFEPSFLRQEYDNLLRECGSIRVFKEMYRYEYEDMVSLQAAHSQRQYKLMNRLCAFWACLADVQHRLTNYTPLIFIMFDDIDLAPERSMELLMSAYKFFSSPHVVIILTAAQKTLRQVLTYRMYEKVVGSDFASLIQGSEIQGFHQDIWHDSYHMDRASEAAIEYLNKVIPQSSRFELNRFESYEKKQNFRYPIDTAIENYDPESQQSIPLGYFVLRCIQECGLLLNKANFVADRDKPTSDIVREYYLLFGDKNRYITNACLGILNACEQLQEQKKIFQRQKQDKRRKNTKPDIGYVQEIYYILRHLLTILITSNTRNLEDCSTWVNELFLFRYGDHYLFVNYEFLLQQYKMLLHELEESVSRELAAARLGMPEEAYAARYRDCLHEQRQELKQKISALFVMLVFIEHLTAVLAPYFYDALGQSGRTRKVHGVKQFLEFINMNQLNTSGTTQLTLFPNVNSMDEALHLYGILLERAEFDDFSITNPEQVAAYFFYLHSHSELMELLDPTNPDGESDSGLIRTYRSNPAWLHSICSMLYMTQSGIQLLSSGFFSNFMLFAQDLSLLPGLTAQKAIFQRNAARFSKEWNLLAHSVSLLHDITQQDNEDAQQQVESLKNPELQPDSTFLPTSYDWVDVCAAILFPMPDSHAVQRVLVQRLTELGAANARIPLTECAQLVILKTESLLRQCAVDLPKLSLHAYAKQEDFADIRMDVVTLCEYLPTMESLGNSVLSQLEKSLAADYVEISFAPLLYFLNTCSSQLRQLDETGLLDQQPMQSYYHSLLIELGSSFKLCFTDQDKENILGFLFNLRTLNAALPYYFGAQFYLANEQRYDALHLEPLMQLAQDELRKGAHIAAEKYQQLLVAQDKPEHRMLREMFASVREECANPLLQQFGVMK